MARFGGEEKTKEFARLFMVPGMDHCGFGTGPNRFDSAAFGGAQPPAADPKRDMFTALSHWVEDGVAPAQVIATKFVGGDASKGIEMQRPLCPYPQRAWYKGDGDTNAAANFACALDKK
ncbi:MAG TPA: tannase/feruloyl esterase family alpha/beta hydrolase [Roseiarcus sp.]